MGITSPQDMQPPECPHILGWTACEPPTHHFGIESDSALSSNEMLMVPKSFHNRRKSFFQESVSGNLTIVS